MVLPLEYLFIPCVLVESFIFGSKCFLLFKVYVPKDSGFIDYDDEYRSFGQVCRCETHFWDGTLN